MPSEGSLRDGRSDPGRISTRQDFAAELSLLREGAGLTIRDVARKIGVPPSTIGGYFGGSHLPPVKLSGLLPSILSACGVDDQAEVDGWLAALARVRRAPGRRPANALVPYRGLKSFQPEDAEWFFGRQRLTDVLVGQLRDQYTHARAACRGRAVRIGEVVAAAGWSHPGDPQWRAGHCGRPRLADSAFHARAPSRWPSGHAIRNWLPRGGPPAVIVVDQFEEVFTLCQDEEERRPSSRRCARPPPGRRRSTRRGAAGRLLPARAAPPGTGS